MDWFQVLKAARRSAIDGRITSEALADAMSTKGPPVPVKVASAWLGKFVRWGYVLREESDQNGLPGRPKANYRMTKWGLNREAPKNKLVHPKPLKLVANPKKKKDEDEDI
jgi:hypothetical protein